MKLSDLLGYKYFLRDGAEYRVIDGKPRWFIYRKHWMGRKTDTPVDVTAVVARALRSGRMFTEPSHPNAIKNSDWPIKKAFLGSKCGFYFLIEPHCHGNGGWCGQSIHRAGSLKELLKLCPPEHGWSGNHGPYAHNPEPRICTEPNVNRSIILWDSEELAWREEKSGRILSRFYSSTTYQPA